MKKTGKTRDGILRVAAELFKRFGFDKTSMDDIATLSHKAKRSLYNYFPGKEELFAAVVEKELDNARNALQPIFENGHLLLQDKMRDYIIRRMELFNESGAYQLMLRTDVNSEFDLRFNQVNKLRQTFDQWEFEHFRCIAEEAKNDEANQAFPEFSAEAFADMMQMVLKSLEISFFVQGKYQSYKNTFSIFIKSVVESMIRTSNAK